jgi:ubiquinone/menaquinone biosynthesis C-methylase UbiE
LSGRICPWWLGSLLASPVRRFFHDPKEILTPYIKKGMTVLEIGSGMGFFSLPPAHVISIDLQEKMIQGLMKRARKAGLERRIEARVCAADSLKIEDLAGKVDFAMVFAVIHEVPDKERLLSEISGAMKQGGELLIADPKAHESAKNFDETIAMTEAAGFQVLDHPAIRRSYTVLARKSAGTGR